MFKGLKDGFGKLFSGKNLIIVILVGTAFFMLHTYRQNDPLPVATVVPDFTLQTYDNQSFDLYNINVPVVLVFFSDWKIFNNNMYTAIYKRDIPSLKFIQEEGKAQVIVLTKGIDTPERLEEFLIKKEMPHMSDMYFAADTDEVSKKYGIRSWPHIYVIDGKHRVRYEGKIVSSEQVRKVLGN